jgi:tetratricopeptide (TPR) repeat protein
LTDSEILSVASQRMQGLSAEDYQDAARLTERVVHRSPGNAMALAMSASCVLLLNELGYREISDPDAAAALDRIERSIRLNEESDYAHFVRGRFLLHVRHHHDQAFAEAERALELNPNYTYAHALLGFVTICKGDPENGIPIVEKALRADSRRAGNFNFIEFIALGHFLAARYDLAIEWREKAAQRAGYQPMTCLFLASCFAHLDRMDEARDQLRGVLKAEPGARLAELRKLPFKDIAVDQCFRDGLRKAGMPE